MQGQATRIAARLAKVARRPVLVFLTLALIILGSLTVYAVLTHRNPFCLPITAHGFLKHMTVGNLTKASETILVGSVTQVGPSWQSTRGWITYTDIRVEASEFLKGPLPHATVQLRVDGGATICGSMLAEDQASFVKGEDVLVFLTSSSGPDKHLLVVGGPQGKYTVENDSAWWGSPGNAVPLDDLIAEIDRNL